MFMRWCIGYTDANGKPLDERGRNTRENRSYLYAAGMQSVPIFCEISSSVNENENENEELRIHMYMRVCISMQSRAELHFCTLQVFMY